MKISHAIKLFTLACLVGFTTNINAADVQYYMAVKGLSLRQTNAGAPVVITNESPFRFVAEVLASDTNNVTNVTVTLPSKLLTVITNVAGEEEVADFALEQGFINKALLDAKFAAGAYKFIIRALNDGSNSATLTLPKDLYPDAPHIANWADAQAIESKLPFVVRWDALTNVGSSDLILLNVEETNGNAVLSSPGFFQPGALNGTNLFAEIPLESLDPDHVYDAQLLVVKAAVRNTNSVAGATGVGGYFRQTKFPLVTLPNPGALGRVQFSSLNYSASENDGGAVVTVTRVGDESQTVSVNLATSDGTAADGTNYSGVNTTLTFGSDVTSTNINIPVYNDYKLTGNKTVNLALSGLTGEAVFGSRSNSLLTIVDSQKAGAGTLQFAPATYSVVESAALVTVTVTHTGGTAGAVGVNFHTVDGSAQAGLDYVATNGTLNFASPKTKSLTIPIRILNDSINETNETFFIVLDSTIDGAALGTNVFAKVTILDNDPGGAVSIGNATYTTNENSGFFLLTVNRTGTGTLASGASVDFTTENGTALAGADYFATNGTLTFGSNELTKTISIAVTNDTIAEGDENFFFHITNPQGGAALGAISNATLTIKDDESSVTISNAAVSVNEAGTNVIITLIRSGALLTPVSVDFTTVNGTATNGLDYGATNGTLAFAANVGSKTITIPIINDTIVEGNETFGLRISNPQGGVQLGATTNETVTIVDNDFPGTVQFSSATYSGTEGSNAVIKITRTGGAASGQFVYFQMLPVSATPGLDYTNMTGYITFAAGETNKTILVPLILDTLNESTETVTLTLSILGGGGGLALGPTNLATLSILNKPDPNAVPLTGPVFIKGTIGTTAFNSLASACVATSSGAFQLTPTWTTGSGLSSGLNQMTIEGSRNLGTFIFNNNNGQATYSQTPLQNPTGLRSWVVGNGTGFEGTHGTFTLDAIDNTLKLASGRFTLHMQEDTGSVPGGFIDVTGSFRVSLTP